VSRRGYPHDDTWDEDLSAEDRIYEQATPEEYAAHALSRGRDPHTPAGVCATARVDLFKPNGKYYTTETWRIPEGAIYPSGMRDSLDFRTIDGGPVVVPTQEPWGFPAVITGV
jgi:hypothetical protein